MAMYASIETPDLSQQLRCPKGKEGVELGRTMYDSNKNMIMEAVRALRVAKKNRVLEIGPGNGQHIEEILHKDPHVRYFGLDISETMINEARRFNKELIQGRKASFELYDGHIIPFVNSFFDRILTVNTIYFWDFPKRFLNELYRVLKPGGVLVITCVEAKTMQDLPFVDSSFGLFDIPRMTKLISGSPFTNFNIQTKTERIQSKDGETVDRVYLVTCLQKRRAELGKEHGILLKKNLKEKKCHGH